MKYGISHTLTNDRIKELYHQGDITDEELDCFSDREIAEHEKYGVQVCVLYEENTLFSL